jgi:hypothetical protein
VFFESFYEYYNYIFGELELNVKLPPAASVWCCVDPKYSLANGVDTSSLEPTMLIIRATEAKVGTDISATLLKEFADNIIIKSNTDVHSKRHTQLNSFGKAVTNYLISSQETLNTNSIGNFVH